MKRRILIIVENQSVPPDPRVLNESTSLAANGYEVTVLCPRRKNWLEGRQEVQGVRIYRHPMPREGHTTVGYLWEYGSSLFWEFLYAWWIFLRHGFDVIQGCNPPDHIFLIALPFKLFGVKYIFDHHDASPELYSAKYGGQSLVLRILFWLERCTYRLSDAVIVTNGSYKALATGRGHVPAEDVFIVRNGPHPQSFKAVSPNPEHRAGQRYLVGYVGCMNVQDGLDILVEVARHIKDLGRRDIRFVCVGGGPELEKLRQMVRGLDLVDMVHFTGFVPDQQLLEVLSTADVCVNPDRPCEMNDISTMIKIMEYMALGKPIVQFDSKEGRFSAGEASLYADKVNQIPDFADKILWLLDRPDERKKMGEFGRLRVEKELAWEHSVANLLAAYDRVLNGRAHFQSKALTDVDRREVRAETGSRPDVAVAGDTTLSSKKSQFSYVLITPARNEEAFIEKTIESVLQQTVLPAKWVIVDDGSTDRTAEIVSQYLDGRPWMDLVRRPQRQDRHFAGKVHAFNAGFERVKDVAWDIVGNLDADISFDHDHFEFLLEQFSADSGLGVAGTVFTEAGYRSDKDSFEGGRHVSGACQLFRRQCWQDIGGYVPHRAGGIDWMAVVTARMMGWETRSFRERSFRHYRRLGTAERGVISSLFSYGEKDYYLGGHPVWELFRALYRTSKSPFIVGGLAVAFGYCWAFLRRTPRVVSPELMAFHRKEQMAKLRSIVKSLITFRRIDSFNVSQNRAGEIRVVKRGFDQAIGEADTSRPAGEM